MSPDEISWACVGLAALALLCMAAETFCPKALRRALAWRPRLPRMVHACVRCGQTAGFWVHPSADHVIYGTLRYPLCLSCTSRAEGGSRIVSFDGHEMGARDGQGH